MSHPRPKFAVGEEVSVVCVSRDNIPSTEITGMRKANNFMFINSNEAYTGWIYQLSASTAPNLYALETQLKKIPPEDRLSFGDMMAKLTTEKDLA